MLIAQSGPDFLNFILVGEKKNFLKKHMRCVFMTNLVHLALKCFEIRILVAENP